MGELHLCIRYFTFYENLNKFTEFQPNFQLNRGGTRESEGVGVAVKKLHTQSSIIFQTFPYIY